MTDTPSGDALDELRRVDPVGAHELPASSRARIWAQIEEKRMDTPTQGIGRRGMALSGIVVAVVAGVAVLISRGPATVPGGGPVASGPIGGGGTAMCIQYNFNLVAERDFAFDGTVSAIDGDEVTFAVNTAFWGVDGSAVTLTAEGLADGGVSLDGAPHFAMGERYLVAGDDHFAWGCGYSQAYDADVAAEWAAAR